jgi:hypothetical protein
MIAGFDQKLNAGGLSSAKNPLTPPLPSPHNALCRAALSGPVQEECL